MAIVRKTVFVLPNGDKYDTVEAAVGNLRLLKYQELFVALFPDQKQMVNAWAKVFAERNADIIAAFQRIETEMADISAEIGEKP